VYEPVKILPMVVVPVTVTLAAVGRPAEAVVNVWSEEVASRPFKELSTMKWYWLWPVRPERRTEWDVVAVESRADDEP